MALPAGTPPAAVATLRSEPPTSHDLGEHEMLARQFHRARFLGAGPDGTAVAAQRREDGAEVELRFVQEHAQTDELLERWSRYQLIHHAQVISLQQVEYAGSEWCAVLDTPPLGSLAAALGPGLTLEASLAFLEHVASALAAAHELGLWHGDLSAAAVRLDPRRGARLEFSGVSVWSTDQAPQGLPRRWQEGDAYADVWQLAELAGQLLGGPARARAALPWLDRLQDVDPYRRPAAAELLEPLREAAQEARRSAERLRFQTVDTEPPAPLSARSAGRAARGATGTAAGLPGPGSRVGRFQLEQLLGEGGMGSVFRALDVASGQRVALKLLRPELLGDEGVRYRFKKEARVLKAVRSPYVANLVEANVSDEHGYIALEYVEGKDLASALQELGAPVPEPVALQLVADMCRALVEPHRRGIVHRDIKPQNVLLLGDLRQPAELAIKVCDFGIASGRLSADTVGMTQDGRIWGTPQYMAPEQCQSAPVAPATDVYALGLTLYELLAGQPAFEAGDVFALLRRQVNEDPPSLSERAAVSTGTAALVQRALEKAATRRFADAAELLAAIELIRSGQAAAGAGEAEPLSAAHVQEIGFALELSAQGHELWPYVSDTDRMNQIVGLPPVQVERVQEQDTTHTFLSNQVLGLSLRWREYPFEWVEGHRWSVLRVFETGLIRWYRVRLELEPLASGGTRLRYTMTYEPRYRLLSFLVRFEVGVKQKARLLTMFRRIDALLGQGLMKRSPSPHAAPAAVDARLARRVAAKLELLENAAVAAPIVKALEQHVLLGSEAEIARLRPLRFARAHELDERAFTEACLLGAHHGLLDLMWDVICPLCQIPATFAESLQQLEAHGRCPACELSYPLQFADSVELVFRVSREVRPNELQAYCIGGPAHSPHVAAQLRLEPGEGRVLALALSDGRHRLRCTDLPGVIELDVSGSHAYARADLAIGARLRNITSPPPGGGDARLALEASEPVVQLGSGVQTLGLRNELPRAVTVRIERTATRDDALTAARAWAMPRFRELFPTETLESGRLVAVGQLSFLVVRIADHLGLIERHGDAAALAETVKIFDRVQAAAEAHHGRIASSSMELAIASFERPGDAVAACQSLWTALADRALVRTCVALHRGPAVATSIDDRMAYYGRTLARALELTSELEPHTLLLSAAAIGEDVTALGALGALGSVVPAPRLGAAAWCLRVQRAPE